MERLKSYSRDDGDALGDDGDAMAMFQRTWRTVLQVRTHGHSENAASEPFTPVKRIDAFLYGHQQKIIAKNTKLKIQSALDFEKIFDSVLFIIHQHRHKKGSHNWSVGLRFRLDGKD